MISSVTREMFGSDDDHVALGNRKDQPKCVLVKCIERSTVDLKRGFNLSKSSLIDLDARVFPSNLFLPIGNQGFLNGLD
jgi:hypothetical protein